METDKELTRKELSQSEKIEKLIQYFATLPPNKLDAAYEFLILNATYECDHKLKAFIDNFKK
jgi:hypothetical protein